MTLSLTKQQEILRAVEAGFTQQIDFLCELTRFPSTRGEESAAQQWMTEAFQARGLQIDRWKLDHRELQHLPGYSPVLAPYENAINLVGSSLSKTARGRSLILNGHIDVVPTGPADMWSRPPFSATIEGDWLYGRGAGDMKAGLCANLFALDALAALGFRPAANCFFQSVVEEECTGNGALACLQRGYRAEAALIPEPFNETLVSSQVGVIWLQIRLKGIPTHVAYAAAGVNAIEAVFPLVAALRQLEHRWNAEEDKPAHYAKIAHPLNLNIGKIEGGDWASSVPSWAVLDVRMGIYPGQDLNQAEEAIRRCILTVASQSDFLRENPPEIINHGFRAEGYSLADDVSEAALTATQTLAAAHQLVSGQALRQEAITATTDARFFGLYGGTPTLVYGPLAEHIHGYDERVSLASVLRVTQTIALFIAQWCGLEPL